MKRSDLKFLIKEIVKENTQIQHGQLKMEMKQLEKTGRRMLDDFRKTAQREIGV